MSIEYINRQGKTYYLYQGKTSTGKSKYFFSTKKEGSLAETIPNGFEIYENYNAQVFLRKIQPKLITDEEKFIVEEGIKQYSLVKYFLVEIKNKIIIVYIADQNVDYLSDLLKLSPHKNINDVENLFKQVITYSPMMQFILSDKDKRLFTVQRYCFRSSIDDWIDISFPDKLENLIKKYVPHLGKESYFDLFLYS